MVRRLVTAYVLTLVALQFVALVLLVWRLTPGYRRTPPVRPLPNGLDDTSVTVLVASLNEVARIRPCLEGLLRQGAPLREVYVIDSHSTDGTRAVVEEFARRDARIHLVSDPPLPEGWIGKVWALQHGLSLASSEWILGVDADTEAEPGMVAAVVDAARAHDLEVVSFSPRFDGQTHGERWLQPSMLITLVYRFGAPTGRPRADRVMANGQCFLARRGVLLRHGGYARARQSFADDATLARAFAKDGERVGFLDGRLLYRVRAYSGARQMWREWGRSFDLTDATSAVRQVTDVAFILLVQGIPLLIWIGWFAFGRGTPAIGPLRVLLGVNGVLLGIRALMTFAISGSYEKRGPLFWLSPLSDPLAAFRLVLSSARRPRTWRGRAYGRKTA